MEDSEIRSFFTTLVEEAGLSTDIVSFVDSNPSADLPYHNNTHNFIVGINAYMFGKQLGFSERDLQHVLVAGLFHDYAHTGGTEPDWVNVEKAAAYVISLRGELESHGLSIRHLSDLIWGTCNPDEGIYTIQQQVLRDADLMGWVDQNPDVLMEGLSAEIGVPVTEESTKAFLKARKIYTEPAKEKLLPWR